MRNKLLLGLATLVSFGAAAWAHDPGLSSATLTVGPRQINATAILNPSDLAAAGGDEHTDYRSLAPEILEVRVDRKLLPAKLIAVEKDANANITFQLSYSDNAASDSAAIAGSIEISSRVLERLPFGHRQMVTVKTNDGDTLGERLLSARENRLIVSTPERSAPVTGSRFLAFFFLGIRHILTGYDHLLFLFGLLVVCRNVRSALWLITCFTLAHSLTLALSTFGLVNLQSRLVEPAIAASIVYVGVENLSRGGAPLSSRWILTFIFGLIHGLGFASVLREMGVGGGAASAAVPLASFNLGVEAGQLSIAALVLPALSLLRRRPAFLRLGVPLASLLVAMAGGYWFLERTAFSP